MTTQTDANACPECGAAFESADGLQNHFMNAHLVAKAETATDDTETTSSALVTDADGNTARPPGSAGGPADQSFPSFTPEKPATGSGKLADRLVVLLLLLILGLLGTGIGLVVL